MNSLEEISATNPERYVAFVCRGVASGLHNKVKEGLAELEQAIPPDPEKWDAYFRKGMLCAYLGRNLAAMEALEKALEVDSPPSLPTCIGQQQTDQTFSAHTMRHCWFNITIDRLLYSTTTGREVFYC